MKQKKISFTGYRKYRLAVIVDGRHDDALSVPCGTCSACCSHYQSITIHEDEMDADWILSDTPDEEGRPRLKTNEDGACVYLGEHGCSIYDRRPSACRTYDCRDFAMTGIQPQGLVGQSSVKMAEQTLTAKTQEDWVLLGAMRMATWTCAAENIDHTAETYAGLALLNADKYVEMSSKCIQYMDHLKITEPEKFANMVAGLGNFIKENSGKHIKEIFQACQN